MGNKTALITVFGLGILTGIILSPMSKYVVRHLMQEHYGELAYRCDRAMRDHLISKRKVELEPSTSNVQDLNSKELALLDCQDYDILRKQLIGWGLNENDLSLMALHTIEAKKTDLQDVVRIHELQY